MTYEDVTPLYLDQTAEGCFHSLVQSSLMDMVYGTIDDCVRTV